MTTEAPAEPGRSLVLPFRWRQGEHMAIIGRTGSGKSMLTARLIEARKYRIIIRTKPDDVIYRGAREVSTLRGLERDRDVNAFILDPSYDDHGPEIYATLEWAYRTGGWSIAIDEAFYVTKLGRDMELELEKLMTQGRSLKLTMVCGMQRPAKVPLFLLTEATHLIAFQMDGRDIKRVEEAQGERIAAAIAKLGRFQFAWYNVPEREIWIGRLNLKTGRLEGVDRA